MRTICNIKCRKCRRTLLDDAGVLENVEYAPVECCDTMRQIIQIVESNDGDQQSCANLPQWIVSSLEQSGWTKGKLNCPQCAAKVGSFGFIGGSKCHCRKSMIPCIYVVRSSVDVNFANAPDEASS